ncbi:hypothetical protein P3S67_030109 [Capsicum chacoense]
MANSSTTLFMLLLIVASGSMVLASGPCLTNLGACGKECDQECCQSRCYGNFQNKHPSPICEILPGSAERLCNCYHDC